MSLGAIWHNTVDISYTDAKLEKKLVGKATSMKKSTYLHVVVYL